MKTDIDELMAAAGLDALLVLGRTARNPAMQYFTGPVFLTQGELLKKRGQPPVLFHVPMERDEAARSGLQTRALEGSLSRAAFVDESGGDEIEARALRYRRLFEEYQVHGRIALYGEVELGPAWQALRRLEELGPAVTFVGEGEHHAVLARARSTKDAGEVQRMRQVGEATVAIVAEVADFLTAHQARRGVLVKRDGEQLSIGEVKRQINRLLTERGLETPGGFIFAAGRDAAVPHSQGNDAEPVPTGKTIVFDLFPQEKGGGYHFDFTRTWCLGSAPDPVWHVYEDVRAVLDSVIAALAANTFCRDYQLLACEQFERRGHATLRQAPDLQAGYVHGLGHGLGLGLPEPPLFSHQESNRDQLLPGMVTTIEPGLYYPERGIGVRLEDTIWVRPDGGIEPLATYPLDLELPLSQR